MAKSNVSSFAKFDPAHLLDGLFVPKVKKGQALYDVQGEFDGGMVSFEGVQLGVEHQSVLLAIAARTGRQSAADGLLVKGSGNDLMARQFSLLDAAGGASDLDVSKVECSAYALLTDAGMPTGADNYKKLKKLLQQMATVVLWREKGGLGGTSNLLSAQVNGDKLIISLNWRLTDAIFKGQNIQVSLHERHELGMVSKILHTWLSGNIRRGGHIGISGNGVFINTLVNHVWGKRPASEVTKRKRQALIRKALGEIGKLNGWVARIDGDRAHISRPKELPNSPLGEELLPGDIAEHTEYLRSLIKF